MLALRHALVSTITITICCLCCTFASVNAQFFLPNDPAITYYGRTFLNSDGYIQFDWSGIQIATQFLSTSISVYLQDVGNEYNVFIDGDLVQVLNTTATPKPQLYNLASGLLHIPHSLLITKRTEALFGIVTVTGFELDGQQYSSLIPPLKPTTTRKIEFIGDSITCGYGILGQYPCHFSASTEDNYVSYGPIVADHFNAELYLECWSGKGMVRNYGDPNITSTVPFPMYYSRTLANDPTDKWNFNQYQPDAVVVNLGTNDYSTQPYPPQDIFIDGYINFLTGLHEHYGNDVPILTVCGPLISGACCDYVQQVVEMQVNQGYKVYYVDMQGLLQIPQDLGCDGHPNVSGHAKMAATMINAIQTNLGWN